MSQISQKSISGITSITTPAGVDNQFTVHTNNTSEALKLDHAGNIHIHNHVNTTGISSASNFKTGSSNLHSSGLSAASIDVGSNIKLGNAGVITATSFVGDGSDLTNLPAGLGTALSATATSPLNKMYYTNQVLGVPSSITVDVPTSASKAYTQYADIKVESSADLIVAEGDDLIPDVLGLADFGTFGGGASAGRIRVNSISNAANDGSPTVQKGLVVTGVTTSTTFSGSGASLTNLPSAQLTGALPAIDGSNLTGLSGVSVANQADNRLITCTGTTDSLNGEQYLTYTSQSSLNNTDGNGTSLLGGNYLLLKRTTGNTNYINAPLANADLVISADENLLFHTVHTADYNSTERARIDSSGRVMIGTTNEGEANADDLTIATTGHTGITLRSGTSNYGQIFFSDAESGTGEYEGIIAYDHSNNSMVFHTTRAERLRIDSSGHVMIGTTTEGFASYGDQFTIANSGHCGMTIRSGTSSYGTIYFSDGDDGSADEVRGFIDYNHTTNQMQLGTNAATKLRINSSGQVTIPNQPILSMKVNSSIQSGNYLIASGVITNNGNHYNTGNGRFTCPVAGFYYASIMVMSNNSNTTMDIELHKNSSNASDILVPYQAATGGQYNQVSGSCILQCSANDILQFKLNSGSIYDGRHSNITFALLA